MHYGRSKLRVVIDTIPVMAWVVLPTGAIDFINQRWREIYGPLFGGGDYRADEHDSSRIGGYQVQPSITNGQEWTLVAPSVCISDAIGPAPLSPSVGLAKHAHEIP